MYLFVIYLVVLSAVQASHVLDKWREAVLEINVCVLKSVCKVMILFYIDIKIFQSQVQWGTHVIPASQGAEVEGSLEPRS
jgi:hypothetical protein